MLETLIHEEAESAAKRLQKQHPKLKKEIEKAYAYAVFPSVGRAGVVLGGAYGQGEVYEQGQPVGFATLSQMTVGVQVGGQTFTEVVLFNKKEAFEKFKRLGSVGFSAHASAVILKIAASGTTNFADVVAHSFSSGGMLLEASLGGSKIMFIPPEKSDGQRKVKPSESQGTGIEDTASIIAGIDTKDLAGGVVGKKVLEKLMSHPILSSAVSTLRFISPVLPHKKGVLSIVGKFANQLSALQAEQKVSESLHSEIDVVLQLIHEMNPKLESRIKDAYAYAVFPNIGGASLVVGGAAGKGEIIEQHKVAGYAQLIQVTIGVQLGGQTFTEILVFSDKASLDKFKQGKISFAANAAATMVKAGVMKTTKYQGIEIVAITDGGMVIEAALGAQKFIFKPAFLSKGKVDRWGNGKVPGEGKIQEGGKSQEQDKSQEQGQGEGKDNSEESKQEEKKEDALVKKIGRFIVKQVP